MINKIMDTALSNGRFKLVRWTDDVFKDIALPAGINGPIPGAASKYASNQAGAIASPALLKAIIVSSAGMAGTGYSGDTCYAEYRHKSMVNGKVQTWVEAVRYDRAQGTLSGNISREIAGMEECEKYIFSDTEGDGVAVLLSMFDTFLANEEFKTTYEEVLSGLNSPDTSSMEFYKKLAVLTSNILARTDSDYKKEDPVRVTASSSISLFPELEMQKTFIDVITAGSFTKYGKSGRSVSDFETGEELNGAFKFGDLEYPIPVASLTASYIPPTEIVEFLQDLRMTNENPKKIRTLLLRGDVGSGKSMGSYAIAAATAKPYVTLVGGPDTSAETTFGSFAPRTKKESIKDIPTYEEMLFEPEESYKKLTGRELEEGQSTDIGELFTLSLNKAQEAVTEDTQFDFVYSDIILGLKNGWCVEIQEIDKITNPGVLTQLNNLIEFGYVKLPNGEMVYRHTDSILIFTMNTDCVASRPIDQSVISRCDEVIDLETPALAEMVKRAMARTGCTDKELATELAKRVARVSEFCKEQGITDGSCGFRELISWLSVCTAGRDPEETEDRFLIQKATASKEDQAHIRSMLEGSPLN